MRGCFVTALLIGLVLHLTGGAEDAIYFPDDPDIEASSTARPNSNSGQECRQYGYKGTCVRPRQCSRFQRELHNQHLCRWDRNVPIVCCPDRYVLKDFSSKPDVRPYNNGNAVCGTRALDRVPAGNTARRRPNFGWRRRYRREDIINRPPPLPAAADDEPPAEFATDMFFVQGGTDARRGAWPWMATIGRNDKGAMKWFCGGAVINSQHVLTAAHCTIASGKPEVVRLGEHNIASSADDNTVIDFKVAKITPHPEYSYPQAYNDIAILRLDRSIQYNNAMQPICLPYPGLEERFAGKKEAIVTGWGHLQFFGETSPILQQVSLDIYNTSLCVSIYEKIQAVGYQLPRGIDKSQMCAGKVEGGKDACQGDSGGPLVVKDGNHFSLIGLVSTGIGCGFPGIPGIYTRVSPFLRWIQDVAGPMPKVP